MNTQKYEKPYLCRMLTEFIRYLSAERRYSPLTVRNYKHDVEQFLAWLDCDESRFDPRSVTTEQIREWIISARRRESSAPGR